MILGIELVVFSGNFGLDVGVMIDGVLMIEVFLSGVVIG